MKPFVTAMCLTYGRSSPLMESVESFLRQDYPSDRRELLIVNDMPQQEFVTDIPGIRIINVPERFSSLGAKRNFSVSASCNGLVITWADDDIHLPWRISESVSVWVKSEGFIRERTHYYSEGEVIKHVNWSAAGPFLMSKSDFRETGGISCISSGEDIDFLERVRSIKLAISFAKKPALIYRWGTPYYHVSGYTESGWDQVQRRVENDIREGREPAGRIKLSPRWDRDYVAWAESVMPAQVD